MSRDELNKINKPPFGSTLSCTVCILLVVAILVAWSVSGVFAKYVTSDNSSNSAGVAGVGVEIFSLAEHGQTVVGFDYSNVVPGVDIPGPHIQLKINSSVSYTLYLKVTTFNCPTYIDVEGEQVQVVYFDMTADWEPVESVTVDGYTVSTYKFVVGTADTVSNYVFKAGEEYSYVDDNEITILKDDVIYVSERYGEFRDSEDLSFSIKFEAYILQVL